jgi:signal transduction histidine kinase
MKIKTRLSIQFTLVVLGILLIFSVLVYYFSYSSQLSKYRQNLLERAQNTAILLINVQEVDSTLLKKIHQTTKSLEEEEIALTNSSNKLLYSNEVKYLTGQISGRPTTATSPAYFSIGHKDGVIYDHEVNGQLYHVYVLAYDKYRAESLHDLRNVLQWSILFSVWLSVWASYLFSKLAINPISKIISKVKEINSYKLNSRLDEGKGQDEIEQLSITFNQMLSDLELAFKSQTEFVSNASHELRTPLAIMIAESDYMIGRERTTEEYRKHIKGLNEDLRNLNHLINSLLELAHLNRDNTMLQSEVRVDELIFNAIKSIKSKYPGRKVLPEIEFTENESDLIISGNAGLLEIAFRNLIDNACKFSDTDVLVKVSSTESLLSVSVLDQGIGIPLTEISNIFNSFKRGANVKFIGGFGIGLSIVARVAELHNAEIKVTSIENTSTRFEIQFPKPAQS